jgi:hypothetical protein
LTFLEIHESISILGTPCIPNIFKATLSLPAVADGTL